MLKKTNLSGSGNEHYTSIISNSILDVFSDFLMWDDKNWLQTTAFEAVKCQDGIPVLIYKNKICHTYLMAFVISAHFSIGSKLSVSPIDCIEAFESDFIP